MRRLSLFAALTLLLIFSARVDAATGRIVKVLPHYLDLQGRHTVHPSLFERDAYQAELRNNPASRSGIRFDVQWRSRSADTSSLRLRVEVRAIQGTTTHTKILEQASLKKSWLENWASVSFTGEEYKSFGELNAWRATLWQGDTLLDEYKSFLW